MQIPSEYVLLKNLKRAKITSCKAKDAQKMIDFLVDLANTTDYMIRYPNEVVSDVKKEEEYLIKTLESEQNVFITCMVDGEIVGNIGVYAVGSVNKLKHRAEIGIGVKKEYRNLGIGSLLLEKALAFAKEMNYEQIELDVVSENDAAIALYRKFGFETVGVIPRGIKRKDQQYYDLNIMVKRFD
ncbi:MAG: GNAT family N-acetyltransferase [Erysipelotrichaceae bacterium]|nr:GNAT family N-acetyltransferase [Erysipelotrichaceae bacterium]